MTGSGAVPTRAAGEPARRGRVRIAAWLLVAAVTLGLAGSAVAASNDQEATIVMAEMKFTPAALTLKAGVPTKLTIRNAGKVEHELLLYAVPTAAVTDWDEYAMANTYWRGLGEVKVEFSGQGAAAGVSMFEVEVQPGRAAVVEFTPRKTGTYEIGCHVTGHYEAGMKGTITFK